MNECILWGGYKDKLGYGWRSFRGKRTGAHRAAYCEAHGLSLEDIAGRVVRHTCDNPQCINTDHLLIGTHADNVADKVERGRTARGEDHGLTTLSSVQVEEIRGRYLPGCRSNGGAALAREFGVSTATVSRIVNGLSWAGERHDEHASDTTQ